MKCRASCQTQTQESVPDSGDTSVGRQWVCVYLIAASTSVEAFTGLVAFLPAKRETCAQWMAQAGGSRVKGETGRMVERRVWVMECGMIMLDMK